MILPSLRTGLFALAFSSLLSLPFASSVCAETGEARGATMVRDHAAASGKVVDRIAVRAKLTILDFSADGGWVHVRTKSGHEGWVPVSTVRTKDGSSAAVAAAEGPAAAVAEDDSLAKRRNVRGEAWVSKSKYHDDDNKMTVVATKAELYGRPVAAGTVLGLVRRGETVQFVRKSADKKWVQIDIGAGELAWVDSRAVRMGADMGSEPPSREERRDDRRDEPAPTPSKRRGDAPSPEEVRPLVVSLNRLFDLVQAQVEGQRRFVADAAHQLRMPLAGLQTQVEAWAQMANSRRPNCLNQH